MPTRVDDSRLERRQPRVTGFIRVAAVHVAVDKQICIAAAEPSPQSHPPRRIAAQSVGGRVGAKGTSRCVGDERIDAVSGSAHVVEPAPNQIVLAVNLVAATHFESTLIGRRGRRWHEAPVNLRSRHARPADAVLGLQKTARTRGEAIVLGSAIVHDRHDAHAVETATGRIPANIGEQVRLMAHECPVDKVCRLPESDDVLHARLRETTVIYDEPVPHSMDRHGPNVEGSILDDRTDMFPVDTVARRRQPHVSEMRVIVGSVHAEEVELTLVPEDETVLESADGRTVYHGCTSSSEQPNQQDDRYECATTRANTLHGHENSLLSGKRGVGWAAKSALIPPLIAVRAIVGSV